MEQRRGALGAHDRFCGVKGVAVVVAGREVRIIVAPLELEAGLENFGGHVDDGGSEVTKESCSKSVSHQPEAILDGEEAALPYQLSGMQDWAARRNR